MKTYHLNDVLSFAVGGRGLNFLDSGWTVPEIWGTWSDGRGKLTINLPHQSSGPLEIRLNFMAYLPPKHLNEQVKTLVNGAEVASWDFNGGQPNWERRAIIPAEIVENNKIEIEIVSPNAISPMQAGMSADARTLGIGLKTLQILSAPFN